MTRPRQECKCKSLSKGKVGETVVADQRNLTACIANIAAKVENDQKESVRKLIQAHDMLARTVHAALMRTCSSQRSRPGG
jgi:hypothetical protein